MCKIGCFLILCAWNLICLALMYGGLYFFDDVARFKHFVLSFEGAFLGFLLISIANLFSLKKRIDRQVEDLKMLELAERKKQRFSKLILGLNISASLSRILAYVVFCVILWALMSKQEFFIMAFVSGVLASLLGVVGLQILKSLRS